MRYLIAFLVVAMTAACASLGEKLPPPPSTAEIVQMAKDNQPADVIIERMKQSRAIYRLPASELAKLREQGVPDPVIDYMQQTYLEDARYREWLRSGYWYPAYPFRPSPYPYPYWRHPGW